MIAATKKLWRQYPLTYDQTRDVAKEVRRALAIERPKTRTRGSPTRTGRGKTPHRSCLSHEGTRGLLVRCFCVWLTEHR